MPINEVLLMISYTCLEFAVNVLCFKTFTWYDFVSCRPLEQPAFPGIINCTTVFCTVIQYKDTYCISMCFHGNTSRSATAVVRSNYVWQVLSKLQALKNYKRLKHAQQVFLSIFKINYSFYCPLLTTVGFPHCINSNTFRCI